MLKHSQINGVNILKNMLYVRKLFTQDLRDGKQIAFPKEPSYSFFSFDFQNKEQDRQISFVFRAKFGQYEEFEGKTITSRLYAAGSESRMDGEVKAFIRDELNAEVDDLLIFKNRGTKFTDFDVMFVPKSNQYYALLINLCGGENHTVYTFNEEKDGDSAEDKSLQRIYYGAPGTGKSFEINRLTKGKEVIRTTFHPDSDYSTFVGAYKPTSIEVPVRDVTGKVIVENNQQVTENRIVYEFVEQAFLQAYIKAWKAYADKGSEKKAKEQYLVIEEINRGNCAQIFGDLFQLLDRNGVGFSDYPITADKDMKKQLAKAFKGITIADAERINSFYEKDVVSKVLCGEILLLPDNLYIWATMNTSDQSLFPIDSAFKRRWDWKYIPIGEGMTETGESMGYKIKVKGIRYDWWTFLEKINKEIDDQTKSEDKKLGYFFCKANNGIINAETFVSKVVFYLWNDVFKDQDVGSIFSDGDDELTFSKFYDTDALGKAIVKEDKVEILLKNLGVPPLENDLSIDSVEDETEVEGNNYDRYSINGSAPKGKSDLGLSIVTQYLKDHSDMTFQEIKETFPDSMLGDVASRGLIVEVDKPLDSYERYYAPELHVSSDGVSFRIFKQWIVQNIDNIINFAKGQGWSIEKAGIWDRKS